jgi:drug/metabolite transporter (DMT)-like permease
METDSHAGQRLGLACELVRCNAGRISPRNLAMTERLSFAQIAILCAYAFSMAGGQMLFKLAALRVSPERPLTEEVFALVQNGYFLAALAGYFALAVIWVWILTFTPLSRAYPFVALAFAVTPVFGAVLFSEPLTTRLIVGIAVILCGLLLVAG